MQHKFYEEQCWNWNSREKLQNNVKVNVPETRPSSRTKAKSSLVLHSHFLKSDFQGIYSMYGE